MNVWVDSDSIRLPEATVCNGSRGFIGGCVGTVV